MKVSQIKQRLLNLVKDLDKLDDDSEVLMTSQVCGYESGEYPLDDLVLSLDEDESMIEFWFQTEVM